MIFGTDMIAAIQQGRKTQTRRPVKPGQAELKDCFYQPGRLVSVHEKRCEPCKFKITVLEVRMEPVGLISDDDARREGLRNRQGFLAKWHELYGKRRAMPSMAFVITFGVGDLRDRDRYMRGGIIAPPKCRKCRRGLPSTNGEIVSHCPNCGTRSPKATDDDHGYTTMKSRGVRGEPPAIPAALQEVYTMESRERAQSANRQAWEREHAKISTAIDTALAAAKKHGLDNATVKRLKRLKHDLAGIDRRVPHPPRGEADLSERIAA